MKHLILLTCVFVLSSACMGPPSDKLVSSNRSANDALVPPASSANHNAVNSGAMEHSAMEHSAMDSSPNAGSAPYDLQFIDTMSMHHKGAIDMATLAETRAQHPEVKQLAAGIVGDQEREIAKMSQWRDSWFPEKSKAVNMEMPGMGHGMGGMDLNKLGGLQGNEFDVEFLKQMIAHHQGAIEMARDLQTRDARGELKELATDIISAQQSEIKDMQDWLNKWQSH
jgi:uncharacterized protein (DUF305 family)